MEIREFSKIVYFVAAAYPSFTVKQDMLEAYHAILGDLEPGLLKAAALQLASERRAFFPSAGELRTAAFDLLERGDGTPTASEAWGEVKLQIGAVGYVGTPEFSHPLIGKAVRIIGWRDLCWSDNAVAERARYIQAYEALLNRQRTEVAMLPQVRDTVLALSGDGRKRLTNGNHPPTDPG